MGARQYHPVLARFLQVDPIEGGTNNDYEYVTDPINETDLTGCLVCDDWSLRQVALYGWQPAYKGTAGPSVSMGSYGATAFAYRARNRNGFGQFLASIQGPGSKPKSQVMNISRGWSPWRRITASTYNPTRITSLKFSYSSFSDWDPELLEIEVWAYRQVGTTYEWHCDRWVAPLRIVK
ncbi:MAG: RHS repeat-associated core domain-containing protein [Microthrixaceae bacterium]